MSSTTTTRSSGTSQRRDDSVADSNSNESTSSCGDGVVVENNTSSSGSNSSSNNNIHGMHWFRKGLRITDNPALHHGVVNCQPTKFYPVYVLDGDCFQLRHCSALRANFLLECIQDLDERLRTLCGGNKLYVVKGDPVVVLPILWQRWNITYMTYDEDETGEIYATQRDNAVNDIAGRHNVEVHAIPTDTIHSLKKYADMAMAANVPLPNSMTTFHTHFKKRMGSVPKPLEIPKPFPPPSCDDDDDDGNDGYKPPKKATDIPWPRNVPRSEVTPLWGPKDCTPNKLQKAIVRGGETIALQVLHSNILSKPSYVAKFEKPSTSCTAVDKPSTTSISPYMSLGCLSPRTVWYAIDDAISRSKYSDNEKEISKPPVSLHGQLLWREFNNLMAHDAGSSWCKISGNKYCRSIPWDDINTTYIDAWKNGRTGYPWIDACMMQLRNEGWIHHLGRHAVACFLTRGDLWQSWTLGAHHFESQLLDADYAINNFNWLWLSCSGFFYQYFRCYGPVSFQKKNDPSGKYIRKHLPILRKLPDKYIYEPWKAPPAVLKTAGIVLGKTYPKPIVDHAVVSKENMNRMKITYDLIKQAKMANTTATVSSASSARNTKSVNNNVGGRKDNNGKRSGGGRMMASRISKTSSSEGGAQSSGNSGTSSNNNNINNSNPPPKKKQRRRQTKMDTFIVK